jgi:pyridoxamine 5'-phosphate oxidase
MLVQLSHLLFYLYATKKSIMSDQYADLRQTYKFASLDISDVAPDPIEQFEKWFQEAKTSGQLEPNAFTLATCGHDMRPSARTVLLKGQQNESFIFFTNYESKKGRELIENPSASMHFLWLPLERQIRIEGRFEYLDEVQSSQYFQSRPRDSQIGAWVSPQSKAIESRSVLEAKQAEIEELFKGEAILPKPPHWGGFSLRADYLEFWQGRPSRLHDRIAYSLQTDGTWSIQRLAP